MKTVNNKRTIQFEPSDTTIGKNVARIPIIEIPNETDPAFKTFMSDLIANVKTAINSMSEAQREAIDKVEKYKEEINSCEDPDDLTSLVALSKDLPNPYQAVVGKLIAERAKELGFVIDKQLKAYVKPAAPQQEPSQQPPAQEPATQAPPQQATKAKPSFPDNGITLPSQSRNWK
jgi:hypothetical protein